MNADIIIFESPTIGQDFIQRFETIDKDDLTRKCQLFLQRLNLRFNVDNFIYREATEKDMVAYKFRKI